MGRELSPATPPANAMVPQNYAGRDEVCFPLAVHFCSSCYHLQLVNVTENIAKIAKERGVETWPLLTQQLCNK